MNRRPLLDSKRLKETSLMFAARRKTEIFWTSEDI